MNPDRKQWKYLPARHVETLEATIATLTAELAAERALADQLAKALRSSEERIYSDMFHDGVVTDKVREYVSDHHSLAAWREARRSAEDRDDNRSALIDAHHVLTSEDK